MGNCGPCAARANAEQQTLSAEVYYQAIAGGVVRYRSKQCQEAVRQAARFPGGTCKDTNGNPCGC